MRPYSFLSNRYEKPRYISVVVLSCTPNSKKIGRCANEGAITDAPPTVNKAALPIRAYVPNQFNSNNFCRNPTKMYRKALSAADATAARGTDRNENLLYK